jgi:hypothetical protein
VGKSAFDRKRRKCEMKQKNEGNGNRIKRLAAAFMAVIMLLSNVPYAEDAYAATAAGENTDTVTVENEDSLNVKGTNSFGSMVAASIIVR